MKSGIYKIERTDTNRTYIGQSNNVSGRIGGHLSTLLKNKHPNRYLQEDWNNLPSSYFSFSVLEFCECYELNNREAFWIDYYNSYFPNGYNVCEPGTMMLLEGSKEYFEKKREDKRIKNRNKEIEEMPILLLKFENLKMYKDEQEEFKKSFFDIVLSPKNTNYRHRGIRTINAIIKENNIPFIVDTGQDRKGIDKRKKKTFWIVKSIGSNSWNT